MNTNRRFYSPSTGGFYPEDVHGSAIPADAVEISVALHDGLMHAQTQGKRIEPGPDGMPRAVDPPPPSREQLIRRGERATRAHLDEAAKRLGYDSIAHAVGYADEPAVPRYQAEGIAFRAWRSLVWEALYAAISSSEEAGAGVPEAASLIASLPPLPEVLDPATQI